jgi:Late embryogenesis abundant protein
MKRLLILVALTPLLGSCALFGSVVRTPTFEIKEAGFERFDAPGLDTPPVAVLKLYLEGRNPNPAGGTIQEMAFDVLLDGQKIVGASAPDFTLEANNKPQIIPVTITVPITPGSLQNLLRVVRGDPVSYRLEGAFRVNLGPLGSPKFGPYTFAEGTFKSQTLQTQPPSFSWRADLTRFTLGAGGLVFDLGFEVKNPSAIGYRLIAPLALTVGGKSIARAEVGGTVKGAATSVIYARFQIDPITAASSVFSGNFNFQISGAPTLEVPGLEAYNFPVSVLFGGTAKR